MYNRRLLIFSRQDNAYAVYGNLCGVAKFTLCNSGCNVEVFVSNLAVDSGDEWWGIALVDGVTFAKKLPSFNNFCFEIPTTRLENVGFLLVKNESKPVVVASSYLGNRQVNAITNEQIAQLVLGGNQSSDVGNSKSHQDNTVDVEKLKQIDKQKYLALQKYSSAFEKYYVAGRGDNYLQSVKPELEEIFKKFPPYYPLINKYQDSYFVKIDFPTSDKFFVVGLLAKDNQVKYICYALPSESDQLCDKDFSFVKTSSSGFWMLCQDAENGQITTLQQ